MALIILGGLVSSTVLNLLVMPVLLWVSEAKKAADDPDGGRAPHALALAPAPFASGLRIRSSLRRDRPFRRRRYGEGRPVLERAVKEEPRSAAASRSDSFSLNRPGFREGRGRHGKSHNAQRRNAEYHFRWANAYALSPSTRPVSARSASRPR